MSVYKVGKFYYYDFEFRGRRHCKSTRSTNKRAAERIEQTVKEKLLNRAWGLNEPVHAPTFKEFSKTYLEYQRQNHSENYYELQEDNIEILNRFFCDIRLDEFTVEMVEQFKAERQEEPCKNNSEKPVSPATVNRQLSTLKAFLHYAVVCKRIRYYPLEGLKMLKETERMPHIPTFEEEAKYLAAASQPLRDVGKIMLGTGMRPEEIFKLEPRLVNLSKGWVTIENGKTPGSTRIVPIS